MFEELYEKDIDVTAYLKRINVEQVAKADKETLDEIIYSHQCAVPFENLDVYRYHKPINLDVKSLFEKIVINKRGGYCFELNGLFVKLLLALGYDSYSCFVRVGYGEPHPNPIMHRGIVTRLEDGIYYNDVGFGGPMPSGAVKFEEGLRQDVHGEEFWFEHMDKASDWWVLWRKNETGKADRILVVNTVEQEPIDYMAMSYYCSTSETSIFTKMPMINLRQKNGHYAITDDKFTSKIDGKEHEEIITSDDQLDNILKEYFGLK